MGEDRASGQRVGVVMKFQDGSRRRRTSALAVVGGIALSLAVPAGQSMASQVFVSPDQGGGLVIERQGARLVMATFWRESEGTCFVGTKRGRRYRGTFTAMPGPAPASVRMKRVGDGRHRKLVVRTVPSGPYSSSVRRWTPATVPGWRRVVGLSKRWTPSGAADQCRSQRASASSRVRAPGLCLRKGLASRPHYMRLVCVRDSHKGGSELRWLRWGPERAVARGLDGYSVDCTGCEVVTWPARFVLTRPRVWRGQRLFTHLSIKAKGRIPRGAAKFVKPQTDYRARFRFTDGDAPCLWQWVDERYADYKPMCPN